MKHTIIHLRRLYDSQLVDLLQRMLKVLILLFIFLIGVKCLSTGFKMMGSEFAKTLFDLSGKPFISLMSGMLATVLFQSSSVTTSIIVGLVSAGTLSINGAVPMIMGANLGTSVTNTLVSLGYIKSTENFKKAFAAATVHDFFNILTVAVFLPLEIMTGFIEKAAITCSSFLYGSVAGMTYSSPLKALIKPPVSMIKSFAIDTFGENSSFVMVLLSGFIIIFSLSLIVKIMKVIVESNKTEVINKLLSQNAYTAILFGILITISVQSSSITTSLLIPMAGSGVLSMQAIYPITIGANIGTTATALLAALTGNVAGLSIALVHLLFNLLGTITFFVIPTFRALPIKCSETLANTLDKSRLISFAYIAGIFFIIPLLLIFWF